MNSDDVSKFDQGAAFIAENLPALWRRMWLRLQEEGFSEGLATEILKAYIHAANGGRLEK